MKTLLVLICLSASLAVAQTVDVKGVDAASTDTDASTTTIEIKKGKPGQTLPSQNTWEVADGSADLEGEAATAKEARADWKKKCDEWKKEFRADNKDNKIINVSCGTPACGGDAGAKTCTSKATYKVKTRVN
jgi:hypothetical protein